MIEHYDQQGNLIEDYHSCGCQPVERSAGAAPLDVHVLGTAYWSHRLRAGSSHDEPIRDICNDRCMPDIAATYARLLLGLGSTDHMSEPEVFPCPMCGHEVRVVGGRTTQHYEPVERSAGAAPIDVEAIAAAANAFVEAEPHASPLNETAALAWDELNRLLEPWRDAVIAATYAADREAAE